MTTTDSNDSKLSEGARIERRDILSKVRRVKKEYEGETVATQALTKLETFIETRRTRYDAKPGGLGKKKAAFRVGK